MYAVITEADGTFELSTQVPPESLTPKQARALLAALEPFLATLRDRAAAAREVRGRADERQVVTLPAGRTRERRPARSPAPQEARSSAPGRR